jgi:hypothetical protein
VDRVPPYIEVDAVPVPGTELRWDRNYRVQSVVYPLVTRNGEYQFDPVEVYLDDFEVRLDLGSRVGNGEKVIRLPVANAEEAPAEKKVSAEYQSWFDKNMPPEDKAPKKELEALEAQKKHKPTEVLVNMEDFDGPKSFNFNWRSTAIDYLLDMDFHQGSAAGDYWWDDDGNIAFLGGDASGWEVEMYTRKNQEEAA